MIRRALQSILVAIVLVSFNSTLNAQDDFYADDHIPEIKIIFTEENWDEILDEFFIAGDEERLLCSVEIDGTLLENVGIRYKGFSSASVDRDKNPFNIKLNYVEDQTYQGIDKIKLSNVIQDPSFVREVLSYEIGRKYMPASRANYAKVFINDVYWGLYTNVESLDKQFLEDHYPTVENSFFKGNPSSLDLFGENANLSDSPGENIEDYFELYDLKSDQGWEDLLELVELINDDPTNAELLLNVDRALWMHAFNYAVVNFDSYIGYAQNYYLYQDDNQQFNPMLWDLNMSFGSFRLTDASEYFDGFTVDQAKIIDPLSHFESFSVFPRPLMRNLFEQDTYRRMFLAHLRTIIEENFSNDSYIERATFYQDLIDADVLSDTNKFYTYEDFLANLNTTVTDLISYPGITELMSERSQYLLSYEGIPNSPDINNISTSPELISFGGDLLVTAEISNASEVMLAYRFGGHGLFEKIQMVDDGSNGDEVSGDGIYSYLISNMGNSLHYYLYAENEEAGRFAPERAAYEFYSLTSEVEIGDLVINELMPDNETYITDETGDYDDWIELYNNSEFAISTAGMYLSDDPENLLKWEMPDASIAPNDYLIIWADEQGGEGMYHSNFQLFSTGEFVALSYQDSTVLDSTSFGAINTDLGFARFPNGTGPFVEMNPTFNAVNEPVGIDERSPIEFTLFPNPASDKLYIVGQDLINNRIEIYTSLGQLVYQESMLLEVNTIETSQFSQGLYHVRLISNDLDFTQRIIITH